MSRKSHRHVPVLVCATIVVGLVGRATAQQYVVHDLGTLGGVRSIATDVNASGQVVGLATIPGGTARAFLLTPEPGTWSRDLDLDGANDLMQDLGTLDPLDPPTSGALAWGLNDAGQVCGLAKNDLNQSRAFLWDMGVMVDLGDLGRSTPHNAQDVNEFGAAVGTSYVDSQSFHAFHWSSGAGLEDLGVLPGGNRSGAADINASGQIVGTVSAPGNASTEAALWPSSAGPIVQLGTLGGSDGFASAVNDPGTIVGSARTPSGVFHPFRLVPVSGTYHLDVDLDGANDLMEDLGLLRPGDVLAAANDVNTSGHVVGYSTTTLMPDNTGAHAFLFKNGTLFDLNDLVLPGSGVTLAVAWAINDAGQIVGSGLVGGEEHAFLLDPLPFPFRRRAPVGRPPLRFR